MSIRPRKKKNLEKLKKLERAIVKQSSEETSEDKFDELEEEVKDEIKEPATVHEGLGIEKEEGEGEAYPEIEKTLEHEDNPDKADDEEEEED